jgi:hypothetical protein
MVNDPRRDSAGGHYRSAGFAVLLMGALAVVLGVAAVVTEADLGFIDQQGIFGIACVFLFVGSAMSLSRDDG